MDYGFHRIVSGTIAQKKRLGDIVDTDVDCLVKEEMTIENDSIYINYFVLQLSSMGQRSSFVYKGLRQLYPF